MLTHRRLCQAARCRGPQKGEPNTLRATYIRDTLGRVTALTEYLDNGTTVAYSKLSTYNARSEVTSETAQVRQDNGDLTSSTTTYSYNAILTGGQWKGVVSGGTYMGGIVTRAATDAASGKDTRTDYGYTWWGGALQSSIAHDSDTGDSNNVIWNSSFAYDPAGLLTSAHIEGTGRDADARTRDLAFVTDANGLILQRDETDYTTTTTGNPRELHYYLNGIRVGDISNNGTSNTDYAASVNARNDSGYGAFRNGVNGPTAYADFDQSYDAINGLSYESTPACYTVQAGDTLSTIAQSVWGDPSYWYMIAEANGLTGTESLQAGQSLLLPNKVHNSHNTSDIFRVYDPNTAIGDTMPSAAKPPKAKNGCGVFGQILLVAIAVAVTVVTAGAAVAAMAPAGSVASASLGAGIAALGGGTAAAGVSAGTFIAAGAAGGAIGSIASQGFGVAAGIQSQFSWKGVALSALAGGISGGIGVSGLLKGASPFVQGAARGVLSGTLTQGISVATGLQSKFDWAGVVAGGLGGGVGAWAGSSFNVSGFSAKVVPGMAGGIAGAAATSLVTGRDFGDTLMSQLPSIIGNTVGNLAASGIAGSAGRSGSGGSQYAANEERDAMGRPIDVASDIVVYGRREHGLGWKIADFLGFHGGSKRASFDTSEIARSVAMTIRRAPSATVEFGSGLGHGLYNVGANLVTGAYHLVTTNPLTTIRSTGYALAGGIDSVLAAENTPARVQLANAANSLSNASAYDLGYGVGNVGGNVALLVAPELIAGRAGSIAEIGAAGSGAINPLRAGRLAEIEQLNALGSGGKVSFTPTAAQIDSAAFKVIVGDAKYTAKGAPVGTIYDASLGTGLGEIKNGSSVLDSSYQLRLQTYGALVNDTSFAIYTSRPVNPTFDAWLSRWGVAVQPLPK